MKNMHVILTDKPSRLFIYNGNLGLAKDFQYGSNSIQNQNIYITSDEEIKEGDAYITKNGEICKSHNGSKILLFKTDKKIILTTDPRLAPDVQKIDDDFLEWFVKNQSCEEIEINQEFNPKNMVYGINTNPYKIIIPKEEQKDINAHTGFDDDGNSLNYQGNMLPLKEEPKQETLEEAAETELYITINKIIDGGKDLPKGYSVTRGQAVDYAFKIALEVTKWQQEKSYSKEEMHKLMDDYQNYLVKTNEPVKTFKEWFEQFKKK